MGARLFSAYHGKKGRSTRRAVEVSGTWRVTFEFVGEDVDRGDHEELWLPPEAERPGRAFLERRGDAVFTG